MTETKEVVRHVVGGAIIREGRIFLTQRKASDSFPFGWESPGGSMEESDGNALNALDRELREEVGISITPDPNGNLQAAIWNNWTLPVLIWQGRFDWKKPIVYSMYIVQDFVGEPRPLEGQPGSGWFDEAGFAALRPFLLPANQKAFVTILEAVQHSAFEFWTKKEGVKK